MTPRYAYYCIMPRARWVSVNANYELVEVQGGQRAGLLAKNDACTLLLPTEDKVKFTYSCHLIFEHESDLRNMFVDWGLNNDYGDYEQLEEGSLAHKMINEGTFHDSLEVRKISDQVGYGLFAKEAIVAGDLIGEYTGVISRSTAISQTVADDDHPSAYSLCYPSGDSHQIDSKHMGNMMRYINHSHDPNCIFQSVFINKAAHVAVFAKIGVAMGSQLLLNYGESYWMGQGDENRIIL